jgi:hypothetical protein
MQAAIIIGVVAYSSGSLAMIAISLGAPSTGMVCAITMAVIVYLALCLALLEDADSEIKCNDKFYLQNVLVHIRSSLPERSFLLTWKWWWEVCCDWRYILVGGIFLWVVYFGFVAES